MEIIKLTAGEIAAIELLKAHGGSMLISSIEHKNKTDMFGDTIPGMAVFKKLEKKGLVFFTEEEPTEDMFEFTPTIELVENFTTLVKAYEVKNDND